MRTPDQRSLAGGVSSRSLTLSRRTGAGKESIKLSQDLGGEREVHGAHRTFQVLGPTPPDNRSGNDRTAQEPSEGHRRAQVPGP
jgi:hypothetical protein